MMKWLLRYIYNLERSGKPININLCRNIQLLWSHLIDFFVQLLDAKFLDIQFNQVLFSFKTDPRAKVQPENSQKEQAIAVEKMQKYFMSLFTQNLYFLFVELNDIKWISDFLPNRRLSVFEYFDMISELFFQSLNDLYILLSKGLNHCKLFNSHLVTNLSKQSDSKLISNESNLKKLQDLGYSKEQSQEALTQSRNILELAIDFLKNVVPFNSPDKAKKIDQIDSDESLHSIGYIEEINYGEYTFNDLLKIILESIEDYIDFKPQNFKQLKKQEMIDNIFFIIGRDTSLEPINQAIKDVKQIILGLITENYINADYTNIGMLAYSVACLLSYKRSELLNHKEIFQAVLEILSLFQLASKNLKLLMETQHPSIEKKQLEIIDQIKQLDQCISLFLYISEEAKISSDLLKLGNLVTPESSLMDNPLTNIQEQLERFTKQNQNNIFFQNKEQTAEIFQKVTICQVELFRSMHQMRPENEKVDNFLIHSLIIKSLENLNFMLNIKGYGDFDCQTSFLQNEGLRALFGIKAANKYGQDTNLAYDLKKFNEIQVQSKILLQMVCQNEQSQVKVYENLIKSVLFIQFQEKFKKEEGTDIKSMFNLEEMKQNIPKLQYNLSKKKKSSTPVKNIRNDDKNITTDDKQATTSSKLQQKNLKQQVFKKAEYGEIPLSDFINFFNNVMQIQDLKSFLLACANACIIKKRAPLISKNLTFEEEKKPNSQSNQAVSEKELKTEEVHEDFDRKHPNSKRKKLRKNLPQALPEEAKKDEPQDQYYICLNHSSMKDMIVQYEQNLQIQLGMLSTNLNAPDSDKFQGQKGQIQKFQQEIIYTLLDLFIDQIRDSQMIILQSCKQKQNPSPMGILMKLDQDMFKICDTSGKLLQQKYLFDLVSILSHLTYVLTHTSILVQSLLKHKEGKTFKFIIRNMYYLLTLTLDKQPSLQEESEQQTWVKLSFEESRIHKQKLDAVIEFFKRVMLDNPHLTFVEKRLKSEARLIFQKEVLKNLCELPTSSKYPQWPFLRIIFNVGAVWLIAHILKDEEKDDQTQDKKLESLVVNMQKFRNLIRSTMIKHLINDCQLMLKGGDHQSTFNLFKQIERIQAEIQRNLISFDSNKEQIQLCISALSNILKPFENNKTLWGDKENFKQNSQLGESNLGFMENGMQHSVIDEEMIEDEEEEEEDEESSESQQNDDDELLDSERSERNYRVSEHEQFDEYGDEEENEEDSESDDDDSNNDEGGGIHHEDDIGLFDQANNFREADVDEIQLIENLFGGRGSQDLGDDSEAADEEDYFMEDQSESSIAQLNEGSRPEEAKSEIEDQGIELVEAGQQQEGAEEEDLPEDEYGEDYDSEAGEDEDISDYYDEEDEDEDEDQQEIEIFIGGQNAGDRLSNLDFGAARQNGIQRDDILSMNNMSVDMFNLQHLPNRVMPHINEESEGFDYSEHHLPQEESHDGGNQQQLRPQTYRVPQSQIEGNLGGVLNDLLGLFLNGNNRRPGQPLNINIGNGNGRPMDQQQAQQHNLAKSLIEQSIQANMIAHSPILILQNIFQLNKEMQVTEDLYKLFIKEQNIESQIGSNQVLSRNPTNFNSDNQQAQTNTDQEISTKSQFSNKNPFEGPYKLAQRNLFGAPIIGTGLPRPATTNGIEMINTYQNGNQNSLSILDSVDPEFISALEPEALQNLAETENLINRIQSQGRQDGGQRAIESTVQFIEAITNRDQRAEILRNMPEEIFNSLPPNLYSEGLTLRHAPRHQNQSLNIQALSNMAASPQSSDLAQNLIYQIRPNDRLPFNLGNGRNRPREGRGRLMSLDSQLNDITEYSRVANDPYFRASMLQQTSQVQQPFSIQSNLSFNNFVAYLKDLIAEMSSTVCYDAKGNELSKACESIFQQTLLNSGDNIEVNYLKIAGIVDMAMTWVKFLTNGAFILQREASLMKVLLRITYIRWGITCNLFKWLGEGIQQLKQYHEQQQHLFKQGNHKVEKFGFKLERGGGLPGKLDIVDFVLHCLRCVKQIALESNKISTNASLDLLQIPSQDQLQKTIIRLVNNSVDQSFSLDLETSFIEQLVDALITFNLIINDRPDLINQQAYVIEGKEVWMEDIVSTLATIVKQLALGQESYQLTQKEQQKESLVQQASKYEVSESMVYKLGKLLLTKEFKSKEIQKDIKSIFNDLSVFSNGKDLIQNFFKSSLASALQKFIVIINENKINGEQLKKEVILITQILKIARSSKKQETNICDEDLFFRVVKEISSMIDRKQSESFSIAQVSFIFKEEFRTVMIALFILFEYNLKFIFTEQLEEAPQAKRRSNIPNQRKSALQQQQQQQEQVLMEDLSEIQLQASAASMIGLERQDIMDAIEQHLKIKIKDEKARSDNRLKIFIKFCLEHKKIINSFIRANQQVLNESLRNVIMKVPQILDFDNKRLLFRSQIKKSQRKYRLKYLDISVRRDKIFDDSYEQLKAVAIDRWKGQLNVEFADEQGIDEGGLTREWFIQLSQEIFNPDLALFVQSNAGSTYYPNPKSVIQPEYLHLFKFIGRIVGKALYEQQLLDCYFVKALYKIMLGLPLNYHDVEDFDNELYKNLKWCLEHSVVGLGLTFTETRDYFGISEEIEIIPGGKDIEVTDENKYDYVQKMAYQKLYNSIKKQVDSFLKGFHEVIPKSMVQIFDNRELELLISGLPNIDIMDLKENTIYQNYSADSPVVKWLFQVLEEFDNSERAEFLQFVTGSSKVPVEGFKGLRGSRGIQKFQIVKFFTNDVNRLPQAHTCFKQLELPEYQSKEQLKERLLTAIKEGKTFGFA